MKTNHMNDDAHDDATEQPVSLNNGSTFYASVFAVAAPAPTAGDASGKGRGGLYCNRTRTMRISKKRRIST